MSTDIKAADFSRENLRKAVIRNVWTQGISTYPIAVGLGLGVSFGLFNSSWMLLALSGSLGVAVLAWAINFIGRKNALSVKYLNELRERLQKEREARIQNIATELKELKHEAGSVQLANLKAKYESFVAVIEEKFNPGEITFGRYLGIAEQIYLAGIDNLLEATVALKSVRSIDRSYVEKQLKHLDANGIENSAADYATLHERIRLLDEASAYVEQLLIENEKAMTQMVEPAARLARVKTDRSEASMEMDQAMTELSYLAETMEAHNIKHLHR